MKFHITFKTPDSVNDAICDLPEGKRQEAYDFVNKYVKYGEQITIEFDLENKTAKVLQK